ncbi:type II toxin-antitoxin system PemK/MazF family toxin [Pedobacter sp. SD-b]|uniref:mRNA interferase n=1 Tax=Pedobacter segetis TaxID=2793069 RepID=A0ABS1BN95_9SPHI|nr:type II toxin-antitoxin system PemK/MazF family toxin [Pedobacter segetis]MBK0384278.1 type II toxin-antitoxin system PemK/MazF family toxin [Pedobacter segetis]
MIIRQFEIWLANLNPAGGTVPGKIRPVVIIQTDYLNNVNHPSTLILPITSKVHEKATLLRINLEPDYLNGLENESAILIDQIRSIDNKKLIQKIGIIDNSLHQKIKKAITNVLAL